MKVAKLKLYVTGQTSKTIRAIANLQDLCQQRIPGKYELKIIDIVEEPQMAEDDKILATPTLIKEFPQPVRRVIGDLSDTEKVLFGLDLQTSMDPENNEEI